MIYKLFIPAQAVGANLVYFDMFNAGSTGCDVSLVSLVPVVSGAVAVTGTLGVDLLLTRTTAIGTGGTAATFEGTSTTAATFSAFSDQPLVTSLGITARLTPSGGATAGAVLAWTTVFTEETTMSYAAKCMLKRDNPNLPDLLIKGGTGIRVVQGAVASAGNIGFDVVLRVSRR